MIKIRNFGVNRNGTWRNGPLSVPFLSVITGFHITVRADRAGSEPSSDGHLSVLRASCPSCRLLWLVLCRTPGAGSPSSSSPSSSPAPRSPSWGSAPGESGSGSESDWKIVRVSGSEPMFIKPWCQAVWAADQNPSWVFGSELIPVLIGSSLWETLFWSFSGSDEAETLWCETQSGSGSAGFNCHTFLMWAAAGLWLPLLAAHCATRSPADQFCYWNQFHVASWCFSLGQRSKVSSFLVFVRTNWSWIWTFCPVCSQKSVWFWMDLRF